MQPSQTRLLSWTNYLLSHRVIAVVFTFIISFVPFIGVLGILLAALVTLKKGIVEGAIFTLAATLPYCFVRIAMPNSDAMTPLFIWLAIGIGSVSNLLTWVFAAMMRRKADWSTILQTAALTGVLVVSIVHLAYPDIAEWWFSQLQSFNAQAHTVTEAIKNTANVDMEIDSVKEMQLQAMNTAKLIATGTVVGVTLLLGIWQLVLACWWNAAVYAPGSLQVGLHTIRLSTLAGALFLTSLVFSYLGNSVVLDIMPVLYLLFCAAGLSVLHYFFGMIKTPVVWFWLLLMYATLLIAMPISLVVISTIALLDTWVNLRKKFKRV